jgi:hypothetical protein
MSIAEGIIDGGNPSSVKRLNMRRRIALLACTRLRAAVSHYYIVHFIITLPLGNLQTDCLYQNIRHR